MNSLKENIDLIKKLTHDSIPDIYPMDPAGLCFSTSLSLVVLLATKKIKTQLKRGRVRKPGATKRVTHFWIQIDKEGTIIDATIRQFDKNADRIFLGNPKDNEVAKKFSLSYLHFAGWFKITYDRWAAPFIHDSFPYQDFDKKNIPYCIKIAAILNKEIKKLPAEENFKDFHPYKLFFEPIFIFLGNWNNNKEHFENLSNGIHDFDGLLADAKLWATANC